MIKTAARTAANVTNITAAMTPGCSLAYWMTKIWNLIWEMKCHKCDCHLTECLGMRIYTTVNNDYIDRQRIRYSYFTCWVDGLVGVTLLIWISFLSSDNFWVEDKLVVGLSQSVCWIKKIINSFKTLETIFLGVIAIIVYFLVGFFTCLRGNERLFWLEEVECLI